MGYKVFIVLIWLSVPLFAAAMLNEDMRHYEAETKRQARACKDRAAAISRASAVLTRQARQLGSISEDFQLRDWRRAWNGAKLEAQRELPRLASSALNHYTSTATLLQQQEDKLDGIVKAADNAVRDWEYFLRGQEVLLGLAQDIDQTRLQSGYYRMFPNGRGVYLLLQEHLATLESRYQTQSREQDRLYNNVRQQLADADRQGRDLQRALERLPATMAEDEKLTYAENIRRRYKRFNVQEALAGLMDQAVASQEAGPTNLITTLQR